MKKTKVKKDQKATPVFKEGVKDVNIGDAVENIMVVEEVVVKRITPRTPEEKLCIHCGEPIDMRNEDYTLAILNDKTCSIHKNCWTAWRVKH